MKKKLTVWIHSTSYTYRLDEPEQPIQTLWVERPGWGYLMRRDLWVPRECVPEELRSQGFTPMKGLTDEDVFVCPFCGMYIESIPGYFREQHERECGGSGENHLAMEDAMVSEQRRLIHERGIVERLQREREEQEEAEKKERFDRIKEETAAKQLSKDRKKRLKQETREQLRKR